MKRYKNFIVVLGLLGSIDNLHVIKGQVVPEYKFEQPLAGSIVEAARSKPVNDIINKELKSKALMSQDVSSKSEMPVESSLASKSTSVENQDKNLTIALDKSGVPIQNLNNPFYLSSSLSLGLNNRFLTSNKRVRSEILIPEEKSIQKQIEEPVSAQLLDPNFKNQEPMQVQQEQLIQPELYNQPKQLMPEQLIESEQPMQGSSALAESQSQGITTDLLTTSPTENRAQMKINQMALESTPIIALPSDNPLMSRPVIQSGKRRFPTRKKMQEAQMKKETSVDQTQVASLLDPNFKNQELMQERQQVQPELTQSEIYDQSARNYYTGGKKFAVPSQFATHNYIQFESPQSSWQGQSNSRQESVTFPTRKKMQEAQETSLDQTQVASLPDSVEKNTQNAVVNTFLQDDAVKKGLSSRSRLQTIIDTLRYIKNSFFEMIGFKPSLAENQKVETQLVPIAQGVKNNEIGPTEALEKVRSVIISAAENNMQN